MLLMYVIDTFNTMLIVRKISSIQLEYPSNQMVGAIDWYVFSSSAVWDVVHCEDQHLRICVLVEMCSAGFPKSFT